MRIGIDGGCLANRRGFGRFAREMLAALADARSAHEFIVFVDGPSVPFVTIPEPFELVVVGVNEAPSQAASAAGRRKLGDLFLMGREVARSGIDLVYFPASYSFFPVWNVKRVVVTMHDTLALAQPELVFSRWQGRIAWALKEHAARLWADRIVTTSQSARRDIVAWFGLPEEKVCAVGAGSDAVFRPLPNGFDSEDALRRHGIEPATRYILYVGGLSPNKNLLRLIEAFGQASPHDVQLVLVGDTTDVFHTHVPELRAAVARCGLGDRVSFPGFVPDEDLVHLYNHAYCLAQPSLMEGFGLPPLEAMACGVPVLCSTAGSLPEVVGEAGFYFDPTDVSAIADAISVLFENPRRRAELAEQALGRAERFSWAASARALLDVFDQIDPTWRPRRAVRFFRKSPHLAAAQGEKTREAKGAPSSVEESA